MFGRRYEILRLFGISVKVDLSWLLIFFLITWSLATGLFPAAQGQLPLWQYWLLGMAGAAALFASVTFHEFSHALVARRVGVPVRSITLFLFGGVAEMEDDPPDARSEMLMSAAGPAASIILGMTLGIAWSLARLLAWAEPLALLLGYAAVMNFVLAAFNLFPGFPLDGGRILRSILWRWRGDLVWATDLAARVGKGLGIVLIALGVLGFLSGSFVGGLWWVLIGIFIRLAAASSYRQLLVRRALGGRKVHDFASAEVTAAPSGITVRQLVDDYVYRLHQRVYPVADDGRLLGCVRLETIKRMPPPERSGHQVSEIVEACSAANSIGPDVEAFEALKRMQANRINRLMVTDDQHHLLGLIEEKDLLQFAAHRIELGET